MIFTVGNVQAGFYGHIDTRVQADNRYTGSTGFVEEYADIHFVDPKQGIESGLSLAVRQVTELDESEATLYQLYFAKKLEGLVSSYRLGRLERSDSLGFYTLDGAVLKSAHNDRLFTLYAGKPSRIDDYDSVNGDALYGFDLYFSEIQLPQLSPSIVFDNAFVRCGWQRLEDDESGNAGHETRLNWGLSTGGEINSSAIHGFGLDFNGSYLASENNTEQLQFSAYGDLGKKNRVQFDYETFSLNEPYLSFREQFYSLYVRGRQTSFAASFFYSPNGHTQWISKGRSVLREYGENGYGLTLGMQRREYSGTEYVAQLDYLNLEKDTMASLYLETDYSFSAFIKSRLSAVIQNQNKWLSGNNQALGFEADLQQMLRSGLYFTLSLTRVWNSHLDDEYQFGLKLSYRFDDRKKWWSDD